MVFTGLFSLVLSFFNKLFLLKNKTMISGDLKGGIAKSEKDDVDDGQETVEDVKLEGSPG